MVIVSDGLVENCQKCYSQHGYGLRLERRADVLSCGHCGSNYRIAAGLLERVNS